MYLLGREIQELLTAAELGNLEKLRYIANAVEEFEMKDHWMTQGDKKGRTVLHHAAIYGYMNVMDFIIKDVIESFEDQDVRSELLNLPDYKGRTPLFYAAVESRVEIVRFLIERGAKLESITNDKHVEPGSTALMACAEKNSEECFDALLQERADILARRDDGADATYIAARYGHLDIIQRITEDKKLSLIVNRPTFRGRTALLTAASHGHLKVCKLLFSKGADLNHQDESKSTALMYAATEGYFDLVKWLVKNGANVHLKDNFNDTALMCAQTKGDIEMIKYLKMFKKEEEESEDNVPGGKERVKKGKIGRTASLKMSAKVVSN